MRPSRRQWPPAPRTYFATDTQVLYYSDGSAWQFAVSQAEGISSPTPAAFPRLTYLLAPSTSASAVSATSGLTISDDTSDYRWGSQSIKCVTDGSGRSSYLTVTLGSPVDLSDKILVLGIKIDSFAAYNDLQLRLSGDGFASANFDYCRPAYSSGSQRWVEPGLWEYITINRGGEVGSRPGQWVSNATGLASYTSVNAIRFKLADEGGGAPMIVRIGFIGYFTRLSAGIVSVTFDDSRSSQFTAAKPVMDNCGIRATSYTIANDVQNAQLLSGAYLTQAQLGQLQADSHWEIAAHSFSGSTGAQAHALGYDSVTSHDGEIDLLQLKTWLRQHNALGIDHFALPHGTWSLNVHNTAGANPDVLSMIAKYFNTCATTYSNTFETYPPANRLKLRRYEARSSDTAAKLIAMVNATISYGWWLILVFHDITDSPASSSDYPAAEFSSFIAQLSSSGVACLPVGEVWRQQASLTTGHVS